MTTSGNSERVQSWRKRAKVKLVDIAGGKCQLCGYNKCITALEFHHLDPSEKDFAITGSRNTRAFETMILEIRKCVLVCANCHREIHYDLIDSNTLRSRQFIDETLVLRYTTIVNKLRNRGRLKKGQKLMAKVDWSHHDILQLLDQHKTFAAVGRLLGTHANNIKRRLTLVQQKQMVCSSVVEQ